MVSALPTEIPGDKLRKAIDEFAELLKSTNKSRGELIEIVSKKFDLSPLECDFLIRQLKSVD